MPYDTRPLTAVSRYAAASFLTTIALAGLAIFIVQGAPGQPIQQWKNSAGSVVCTLGSGGLLSGNCTTGLGGGGTSTGAVVTIGNSNWVKKAGDTMTGALTINVTGGTSATKALDVKQVASGAIVHASTQLRSSGTLVVNGAVTLKNTKSCTNTQTDSNGLLSCNSATYQTTSLATDSVWIGSSGLAVAQSVPSCSAATSALQYNTSTHTLGCGSISSGTAYAAGQGLTLTNGNLFTLNPSNSGSLSNYQTQSGYFLKAKTSLASSGTLVIAGTAMLQNTLSVRNTMSGYGLKVMAGNDYILGNLGIGTTKTPVAALEVAGTLSGAALNIMNGASYFLGNVGIGKSIAPSAALDVVGTLSGKALQINGTALAVGYHTYTLPTTQGSANQVLTNNGSDTLSWATPSSTSANYLQAVLVSGTGSVGTGSNMVTPFRIAAHTFTIPANDLYGGHAYKFWAGGQLQDNNANMEFNVYLGNTIVCKSPVAASVGSMGQAAFGTNSWFMSGVLWAVQTPSASAKVVCTFNYGFSPNQNAGVPGTTTVTAGLATNGTLKLQFGGRFDAANAGNLMSGCGSIVEKIAVNAF